MNYLLINFLFQNKQAKLMVVYNRMEYSVYKLFLFIKGLKVTTILMLLMLPIGIYVYFGREKKDQRIYQSVFDDFYLKTLKNKTLTDAQKIEHFEQMLEQNGYEVIEISEHKVVAQKKILSMGLMMIGIGVYIIGLLVYLVYYFYLQKSHEIIFDIYKLKEKS